MEGVYRKIYIRIWRDDDFRGLTKDGQLLFFYFLTSPHGHLAGIFPLPRGYALEDLGSRWDQEELAIAWAELEKKGMAIYDRNAKVLLLPNFLKYNPFENRNTVINAVRHVQQLPETALKGEWCRAAMKHLKGKQAEFVPPLIEAFRETLSEPLPRPSGETEAEAEAEAGEKTMSGSKEPKPDPVPYSQIVEILNSETGRTFKAATGATRALIRARWNEGNRLPDFALVLSVKAEQWKGDPKMLAYLRPQTLFGTKFESYLQEAKLIEKKATARAARGKPCTYPGCGGIGNLKTPRGVRCTDHYEDGYSTGMAGAASP